jgi:polar amino acid transport system permease protein
MRRSTVAAGASAQPCARRRSHPVAPVLSAFGSVSILPRRRDPARPAAVGSAAGAPRSREGVADAPSGSTTRGERLTYFNVNVIVTNLPELLRGAGLTLLLTVEAMALGIVFGLVGCALQLHGGRWPRRAVQAWIEVVRNTPLIVQLFVIYFGLPEFGIRPSANLAALLGLSLYLGAFATEIFRAGIESVPAGQTEAGRALGLRRHLIFRFVVAVPALRAILPALGAQFTLIMLATSVVSTISADDLASIANGLQTTNFRPFEIYLAASLIYLAMALTLRGLLALVAGAYVGRWQE